VKFGRAGCVADAVLGVITQQNFDDLRVDFPRSADSEVERCQSVEIQTVDRRTEVQQGLSPA